MAIFTVLHPARDCLEPAINQGAVAPEWWSNSHRSQTNPTASSMKSREKHSSTLESFNRNLMKNISRSLWLGRLEWNPRARFGTRRPHGWNSSRVPYCSAISDQSGPRIKAHIGAPQQLSGPCRLYTMGLPPSYERGSEEAGQEEAIRKKGELNWASREGSWLCD
jgi:hypothetical protein